MIIGMSGFPVEAAPFVVPALFASAPHVPRVLLLLPCSHAPMHPCSHALLLALLRPLDIATVARYHPTHMTNHLHNYGLNFVSFLGLFILMAVAGTFYSGPTVLGLPAR